MLTTYQQQQQDPGPPAVSVAISAAWKKTLNLL